MILFCSLVWWYNFSPLKNEVFLLMKCALSQTVASLTGLLVSRKTSHPLHLESLQAMPRFLNGMSRTQTAIMGKKVEYL